jgi:hypothetical protein
MKWAFRILATLDALLLLLAFFYQAPGEDPAGAGLRLGFAVVFAISLTAVLLLYRFCKTPWVRVPLLVLLALPALSVLYGISLTL